MSFDKSAHLSCVVYSIHPNRIEEEVKRIKEKRDEIKTKISKYFGTSVYPMLNSGSFSKRTGLNTKFDIDVCVPFRRKNDFFSTLEEMHSSLYEFLNQKCRDQRESNYYDSSIVRVIKQKVSIGVEFLINENLVKLDFVPGREIESDSFKENDINSKDLNLYVSDIYGSLEKGKYIKTNIHKQKELIKGRAREREVIMLLKHWKNNHFADLKSFLIELLVIRCFDDNSATMPTDLWESLKTVLEFARDKITAISLLDPANSSNKVSDTLTEFEKSAVSNSIRDMLSAIESNHETIKSYFKLNPKFPCPNSEKKPTFARETGGTKLSDNVFG